jgi:hypothetical protein
MNLLNPNISEGQYYLLTPDGHRIPVEITRINTSQEYFRIRQNFEGEVLILPIQYTTKFEREVNSEIVKQLE